MPDLRDIEIARTIYFDDNGSGKTTIDRIASIIADYREEIEARAPKQGGEMRDEIARLVARNDKMHANELRLIDENYRMKGWIAQLCERIEEQWPRGTDASTDAAKAREYLALLVRESVEPAEERGPEVGE